MRLYNIQKHTPPPPYPFSSIEQKIQVPIDLVFLGVDLKYLFVVYWICRDVKLELL